MKFLRKLLRDCRGAVTVMVTMLLIPAVLISGTGVDMARIYTARSIVHDANQLAANSVLASYDALLQDLYGLYGVMEDDPTLAQMVNDYIEATVLGEDGFNKEMGSFQLFYGSDLQPGHIEPAEGKNLDDPEVLRRQIEEYVKFRAPAVIVTEILDKLEIFEDIKKDAEVIKDKMEIDDKVEEIDKIYRKLYECILEVNKTAKEESSALESVNQYLSDIRDEFKGMKSAREQYTDAFDEGDEDLQNDLESRFEQHVTNIKNLVNGGTVKENWVSGYLDDEGSWEDGYWDSSYKSNGLNKAIGDYKAKLEKRISNTTFNNDTLNELKSLAEEADQKRADLDQMLDDLERKLNNNECSEALKNGLTEAPKDENNKTIGKSTIESYRDLISYDISAMAENMIDHDDLNQIKRMIELLDTVEYSGKSTAGNQVRISRDFLTKLGSSAGYAIDLIIVNRTLVSSEKVDDSLGDAATVSGYKYDNLTDPFKEFQHEDYKGTKNPEFFKKLQEMYAEGKNKDKKENIQDALNDMLGEIQDQFGGMFDFDPEGAWTYVKASQSADDYQGTDFGTEGDWSKDGEAQDNVQKSMDHDMLTRMGNAFEEAANKILLLTYSTEMFSCFSTNDGESEDEPAEVSMNNIPLGVDVNYYFQSELEYLYNGNMTNAKSNLQAVTSMMFLVRFVFNYIASFAVTEVSKCVDMVKTALAFAGPYAIVAGELVRLAMALGESVIDVGRLKDGALVAIFKTNDTWQFSLSGQLESIDSGDIEALTSSSFTTGEDKDDDPFGVSYKDYLRLFLLFVDGDVLAQRTAKLIELNVTNYKEKIGEQESRQAREKAMGECELFDMSKAITDFSLSTEVQLKMLFLSMPLARNTADGVIPPGVVPITATDYRGY